MIPVLLSAAALPVFLSLPPMPALFRSKTRARDYTCVRMSAAEANEARPGVISPPGPRGDWYERSVVVCEERLLRQGLRPALDEAILSSLESRSNELAIAASAQRPELASQTWLVEVYYPSMPVSSKISFATKNALMEQGLQVSDRTPILGVGDIQVITRMPPEQAYPAACQRYYDNGSLAEGDTLLAVVHRDPQETALHAGLCTQGRWTWLR